jgi:anaerobic ribonucleoside-triphosphate reductase
VSPPTPTRAIRLGGLILNTSGKMIANYWLSHVYPPEVGEAHRDGDLHIHDLDMLAGYCAGWSLRTLLTEGLNGVPGKVEAGPPKHMSSAVGQIVNFLGTLQNEWAGAQAFSSFDTYMAPYVRIDGLDYRAGQAVHPGADLQPQRAEPLGLPDALHQPDLRLGLPGGPARAGAGDRRRGAAFTYGELQAEMDLINRAYIEVMTEGDAKGRIFTFPIPTYNITPDFPWESENAELLFEMTAKYGLPYFQNFINSELSPNMVRSMCCRLQLDLHGAAQARQRPVRLRRADRLARRGHHQLRPARLHPRGDEAGLLRRLDELMELAKKSLELKRKVIQRHMDAGLFPYTKRYLGTLRNHFSTIGVNGINELIRNFTDDAEDITTDWGTTSRRGCSTTCARAWCSSRKRPATCTTWRRRRRRAPPTASPARTRSASPTSCRPAPRRRRTTPTPRSCRWATPTTLPGAGDAGGAAIQVHRRHRAAPVHGRAISSTDACKRLVRRALENFRLPYITVTPIFSICPHHGYIPASTSSAPSATRSCWAA